TVAPVEQLRCARRGFVEDAVHDDRIAESAAVPQRLPHRRLARRAGRDVPQRADPVDGGAAARATHLVDQHHPRTRGGGRKGGPDSGGATAENQYVRLELGHTSEYSGRIQRAASICYPVIPTIASRSTVRRREKPPPNRKAP